MALNWSIASIPELAHLPPAERERAWKLAGRKAFRDWHAWVSLLGCGAIALVGGVLGSLIGHEDLGTAAGSLIALVSFMELMTRVTRGYLPDALRESSQISK
jgi:hypothetical protein